MLLLLLSIPHIIAITEYWNEPFSEGLSKLNENLDTSPERCEQVHKIDSEQLTYELKTYTKCKRKLAPKVIYFCHDTKLKKAGELIYTLKRYGDSKSVNFVCCVKNQTCYKDYQEIGDALQVEAERFLTDTAGYLEDKIKYEGYHTCHPIKNKDASVCHEDCKSLTTKSSLKDRCSDMGGQIKCCIRRHTAHCEECQYCCTIPICTWMSRDDTHQKTITDTEKSSKINKTDMLQAQHSIWSLSSFFMADDTRCLKADENVKPREWETYMPEDFMTATTKKDIAQLRTMPHDERFFNFEDPKVFLLLTGEDFQQQMQEAYGFDFVSKTKYESPMLPCAKQCMKAEYESFALKCKRKKGLFKCCVARLDLKVFEETRQYLYTQGLVNSTTNVCNSTTPSGCENCLFCTVTYSCTTGDDYDPTDKRRVQFFTTFNKTIGGRTVKAVKNYRQITTSMGQNIVYKDYLRPGFRYSYCAHLDFCNPEQVDYYNLDAFIKAKNREEFCQMETKPLTYPVAATVPSSKEEKYCQKRISSNVKVCSTRELKDKSEKAKIVNKELKKYQRQLKRKYRKKRSKRRKKKGKKRSKRKKKKQARKKD